MYLHNSDGVDLCLKAAHDIGSSGITATGNS